MTGINSKSRQQAEIAFGKVQQQFFAKDRAVEELASIVQSRDDKTVRLREARLAKELEAHRGAVAAAVPARPKAG